MDGDRRERGLRAAEAAGSPIVIDVEASGFGRGSYPIEIGVALADGRTACYLVRPEPGWCHWDAAAAALHGLSRDLLHEKGRVVGEVAAALNELLIDEVVYTDAWGMDSSWLALLFEHAGRPQRFRLEALAGLLDDTQRAAWADAKRQVRIEMNLTRHRASADALVIQRALEVTGSLRRLKRRDYPLSATSPESS